MCVMYLLEDCIKDGRKRPYWETLRHLTECALLHTNKVVSKHLSDGNEQDRFSFFKFTISDSSETMALIDNQW